MSSLDSLNSLQEMNDDEEEKQAKNNEEEEDENNHWPLPVYSVHLRDRVPPSKQTFPKSTTDTTTTFTSTTTTTSTTNINTTATVAAASVTAREVVLSDLALLLNHPDTTLTALHQLVQFARSLILGATSASENLENGTKGACLHMHTRQQRQQHAYKQAEIDKDNEVCLQQDFLRHDASYHLNGLPTDLLITIFSYCNSMDLVLVVARVCKRWHSLSMEMPTAAWSHIDLSATAMNLYHCSTGLRKRLPVVAVSYLCRLWTQAVSINLNDFECFSDGDIVRLCQHCQAVSSFSLRTSTPMSTHAYSSICRLPLLAHLDLSANATGDTEAPPPGTYHLIFLSLHVSFLLTYFDHLVCFLVFSSALVYLRLVSVPGVGTRPSSG